MGHDRYPVSPGPARVRSASSPRRPWIACSWAWRAASSAWTGCAPPGSAGAPALECSILGGLFEVEERRERTGEHAEDSDAGEHDDDPGEASGAGVGHDVAVADGRQGDDPPPQRVPDGRELWVGRVLRVVGGERCEHQHQPGDYGDLPQPGGEAPQPGRGQQQPHDPRQAREQQDRRGAADSGDQVVGEGEQDDAEVDLPVAAVQVVGHDPPLHDEVDNEHQPRAGADGDLNPPVFG